MTLQKTGMATALSLDHWTPPASSKCTCETSPDLSVNFLCMHPRNDNNHNNGNSRRRRKSTGKNKDTSTATATSTSSSSSSHEYRPNKQAAARFQEVFVDLASLHCALEAASSRHVLDERFHSFLGRGELEFKRAMMDLMRQSDNDDEENDADGRNEMRETSAFKVLEKMLRQEMGMGGLSLQDERRIQRMSALRESNNAITPVAAAEAALSLTLENHDSFVTKNKRNRAADTDTVTVTVKDRNLPDQLVANAKHDDSSPVQNAAVVNGSRDETEQLNKDAVTIQKLIDTVLQDDFLFRRFALSRTPNQSQNDLSESAAPNNSSSHLSTEELEDLLRTPRLDHFDATRIAQGLTMMQNDARHTNNDDYSASTTTTTTTITQQHQPRHCLQRQKQQLQSLLHPPGHVFVCNASVIDIYCDAFLCPGAIGQDRIHGKIWNQWLMSQESLKEKDDGQLFPLTTKGTRHNNNKNDNDKRHDRSSNRGSTNGHRRHRHNNTKNKSPFERNRTIPLKHYKDYDRVVTLKNWPWRKNHSKGNSENEDNDNAKMPHVPFCVVGEVSLEKSHGTYHKRKKKNSQSTNAGSAPCQEDHLNALMETVRQFVAVALKELKANQPDGPVANRERYLLALPVVGTGGGLAGDLTGHVVERILRLLCELVAQENYAESNEQDDDGDNKNNTSRTLFDCVLVCADEATYSHAQMVRSRFCGLFPASGNRDNASCCGGNNNKDKNNNNSNINNGSKVGSMGITALASLLPCFRLLTPLMREHAKEIAQLASRGHLSMFVGSGVSMGAGLPGWINLLQEVEDDFTSTGKSAERTIGDATGWDPLVMADVLNTISNSRPDRHGSKRNLKERIAGLIQERSRHPSLLLSLLSSFPCKSIVTQNYDRLVERAYACRNVAEKANYRRGRRQRQPRYGENYDSEIDDDEDNDQSLSVIPHRPVRGANRWLLKMHGCVTCPEDIVITGDDYRAYEAGRMRALAGLVQANLMTTHLLFVGYSMSDPNYLRIVEEVRHALKPGAANENETRKACQKRPTTI